MPAGQCNGSFTKGFLYLKPMHRLRKIFAEIKKQTGYTFMYTERQLKQAKNVTISVKEIPWKMTLKLCFYEQPITFSIVEKTVIVTPKEKYLFLKKVQNSTCYGYCKRTGWKTIVGGKYSFKGNQ